MRRLFTLAVLLVALGAAWWYRDRIREVWREFRGLRETPQLPSEALSDMASARIDSLASGSLERAAFAEVELQSLLRYRFAGLLPAFVDSAGVELDGNRIRLRGRVPITILPDEGPLGEVAAILPDTAELSLTGTLLPLDGSRIAVAVNQITAARVPLPRRIVPAALDRLGRTAESGLPADAFALRLPAGVTSAYIRNDSLVLLGQAQAR